MATQILSSPELLDYARAMSLREDDVLRELREETATLPGGSAMQVAAEEGQLLALLVGLCRATRVLEIGTFTGCSGLDAQYEVLEWREGGGNGAVARLAGRLSHSNIRLTRAVDAESGELAAWFSQQQRQPARVDQPRGFRCQRDMQ